MEVKMGYKERLPSEIEEIESLKRYIGFENTKINMLANMNPERILKKNTDDLQINISPNDFENSIKDFINVYGMIYGNGDNRDSFRLYRGTTEEKLYEDKYVYPISTSLDKDIAKTFGDGTLVKINTENGLPCLNIEPYRDMGQRDEAEVLVLPFSTVKKRELLNEVKGDTYYNLTLEKEELPEISDDEMQSLKEQCINGFENFWKQINNTNQDNQELNESIKQYKLTYIKLLKGLCRQRELDKDKARKDNQKEEAKWIIERQKEEQREQEEIFAVKNEELRLIINDKYDKLKSTLTEYMTSFSINSYEYINLAENLGVKTYNTNETTQNLEWKFSQLINGLEYERNRKIRKLRKKENEYNKLIGQEKRIDEIQESLREILELLELYKEDSIEEIKRGLNKRVQDTIYKDECFALEVARRKVLDEKETIFQKILCRNDLKDERLNNINEKMLLASIQMQLRNPSNSIDEMLKGIYECAYKYYEGTLTNEMKNVVSLIRDTYIGIMPEKDLRQEAKIEAESKYLVVTPIKKRSKLFGIFNRKQVKEVRKNTLQIQSDIKLAEKQLKLLSKPLKSEVSKVYIKIQKALDNILEKIDMINVDDNMN